MNTAMNVKIDGFAVAAMLALGLGLGTAAHAGASTDANTGAGASTAAEERDIAAMAGYEQVDSIPALTRLHSYHALDEDSLIVWATAFRPYLVELRHPSHDLRFARTIGVTQRTSRIYPGFDSVQVDGFRYPIARIYKLSRDEAKELARDS